MLLDPNALAIADEINSRFGVGPKSHQTWLNYQIPKEALVVDKGRYSIFKVKNNSKYEGYCFRIPNTNLKERNVMNNPENWETNRAYDASFPEGALMRLFGKDKEPLEITLTEFLETCVSQNVNDYPKKQEIEYLVIPIPKNARLGKYEKTSYFQMPNDGNYKNLTYYLPNSVVYETENNLEVRIPKDFTIKARQKAKLVETTITAEEYQKEMEKKTEESYHKRKEKETVWQQFTLPNFSKVAELEHSTIIKMPNGEYGGFVFYVPKTLVTENGMTGTLRFVWRKDELIHIVKGMGDDRVVKDISLEEFGDAFLNKTNGDFTSYELQRDEMRKKQANKVLDKLDQNIPEILKEHPNWVICRTHKKEGSNKVDKYLIDPNTGSFAKSDDPKTWSSYEVAKEKLRELGGASLAYCLDGKDGIACIDIDHCLVGGKESDIAKTVLSYNPKTYTEVSVSGGGVHIFGKTKGYNVRTFSREGDVEFYQKGHFITLTGNSYPNRPNTLDSFDFGSMSAFIEDHFQKRVAWRGECHGVEGLSKMSDRDVVERAITSKNGEIFAKLYRGENLQNNHSNSDFALMTRLAFWCNGDKEQMLRIFATSGLYRPKKHPSYFETTAEKAIESIRDRYDVNFTKNDESERGGVVDENEKA